MIIQKFLFRWFENRVKNSWKHTKFPDNLNNEYEQLKPTISKIYKNVTHWHGTGRYHYSTKNKYKYQKINLDKTTDVLKQIIIKGGLISHDDPWVKINKVYSSSVSTSSWRMYARTYAELHTPEGNVIYPTYGIRQDIVKFFFYYSILSSPLVAVIRSALKAFSSKHQGKLGPIWAKTINSNFQSKGNAYSDLLHILGKGNSNIKDNYGILVGIKGKNLKQVKINPIVQMFETRFTDKISIKNISHFEVPKKQVAITKELLKKYKVNIPVLPIEICEIYNSNLSINFYNDSQDLLNFTKEEYLKHYRS